jgi:hypothetical protein
VAVGFLPLAAGLFLAKVIFPGGSGFEIQKALQSKIIIEIT